MSTRDRIILYLRLHGQVSGSELEFQARDWQTKGSTISRRCRELADEGKIERVIGDKRTVQYRMGSMSPVDANAYLQRLAREQQITLI